MTKVPCTVSLDDELLKRLDEYAKSLGETRSVVVQRFIREGLKKGKA
jgi:metal-responsive CopG/Arc/MetJ family transcriptional regulator